MAYTSSGFSSLVAAGAGVALHLLWFHHGEHHMYAPRYIQGFTLSYISAIAGLVLFDDASKFQATAIVTSLAAYFLAGLYASLLTWRLFFNPLNRFPGPFQARISNILMCFKYGDLKAFSTNREIHDKYGHFVRTGSNDLSVTHPDAVLKLNAAGTTAIKGDWYDLNEPASTSMQLTRDKVVHDQRRKLWSMAFSDKAIRGYELRIQNYQAKLVDQLTALSGAPFDATKWLNWYGFDVMGDLAFNESFNMLDSSDEHWAIVQLNKSIAPLGLHFPTWFFKILASIPGLSHEWWKWKGYCNKMVDSRMKVDPEIPDIMSTLLLPLKGRGPTPGETKMLHGDSELIIVAGSDTTATTLTFAMAELVKHPENIEILRKETAPYLDKEGKVLNKDVQNLEHLNAIIQETLRLHPPVPNHLPRIVPPEGMTIGDEFIPGGTNVIAPQYAIGRSETSYENADAFIPERWYSRPEMVKHKSAWAPFNIGTYGCIGKPLAMMNIRTTLTRLVHNFDVALAPGDDGTKVDTQSIDHFTLRPGSLMLTFKKRS